MKQHAARFKPGKCVYKNCRLNILNSSAARTLDADAVLFQGNRIPAQRPLHRDNRQVFIFANLECPLYLRFTNLRSQNLTKYFNWTMTYRRDSDIVMPYGAVVPAYTNISRFHRLVQLSSELARVNWFEDLSQRNPVLYSGTRRTTKCVQKHFSNQTSPKQTLKTTSNKTECLKQEHDNYLSIYKRKSHDVAWLVSHCKTRSKREQYVQNMSQYIHVDIYGRCANLTCPRYDKRCLSTIARKYKFYLAFENSLCLDYITEKAFDWFDKFIVLVVRGAREYRRHLPAGTYVDADHFKTPQALARHLRRLGSNPDEYVKLLKRKALYRVIPEAERVHTSFCQLCRMLNNVDSYRKVVKSISYWYERQGICIPSKHIVI